MFRNHFKIALRQLWKHRTYTAINLVGLAIGLAACWVILLYVGNEWSYDRFHRQSSRIYRTAVLASWPGSDLRLATSSAPFGPALKENYPEVENYTRVLTEGGGLLKAGDKRLQTDAVILADSTFFSIFTFPLLAGDPARALAAPDAVVVSESLARRLFGSPAAAMGQQVTWDLRQTSTVTGVMRDVPANSHMRFEAVRSLPGDMSSRWQTFDLYTYILLKPGAHVATLRNRLPDFYDRYMRAEMGEGVDFRMELQPVTDIHLHSTLDYELGPNGSARNTYLYTLIAVLILLIACINYMNISTARSSVRLKEVGVRKSLGSVKQQVAGLFLTESVLLTLMAAVLAIVLTSVVLPYFNVLAQTELSLWQYGMGYTLLVLGLFALLAGLLAGTYPAFFMSGFKTVNALKGKLTSRLGNASLRKGLVAFQFTVAIVLIAVSIVCWRQMRYLQEKDLGFQKDQVVTFHLHDRAVRNQIAAIKAELKKSPYIESVAATSNPIGRNNISSNGFKAEKDGKFEEASLITQNFKADEDFVATMGLQMAEGRNFRADQPGDRYNAILVNETMVKELGLQNPVGKRVQFTADTVRERRIIGVVKDFHIYSLQHRIAPVALMMAPEPSWEDNLYVRLQKGHIPEALQHIRQVYDQFEKNYPLEINFTDDDFARQYAAEQAQGRVFLIFTALAIFIACLGLFGLAAFTAEQRTREIGIRKVLGASVGDITGMLSRDFLRVVLLASVLAVPLAWWAMHRWLEDFAYRISLSWWMFALAGVLALLVAVGTVGYQALRAALNNPVNSLRSE
ncbi:FtsX-like permease family protein [Chitinophaga lutea]|uniref:FtsX-like permease family protein n=1 Tax=Chitinophaga lutea TaxID=2488634 RepID=A0A3N4PUM0_9BACT|nr:ABC transporter permease [Chitinophaga lutea]RPE08741.1 FtsX-like permease family protein [Chitinophaga lutea]